MTGVRSRRPHRRGGPEWNHQTRDFVLFVGGFAGVIFETVVGQVDRPALLALFAGMMGLPVFLGRDERRTNDDDDDDGDEPPRVSDRAAKGS